MVHSGGVHDGHYHAFVRPKIGGDWFKFDDSHVTKVTPEVAIDDNFGGEHTNTYTYQGRSYASTCPKSSSACKSVCLFVCLLFFYLNAH